MKKIFFGAIILGIVSLTALITQGQTASNSCKTFNTAGWTQDQKNSISLISQRLIYNATGLSIKVLDWSNQTGKICFDTTRPVSLLTETSYLAEYEVWQNELALAMAEEETARIQDETDLTNLANQLQLTTCYQELVDLRKAIVRGNYLRPLISLIKCLRI